MDFLSLAKEVSLEIIRTYSRNQEITISDNNRSDLKYNEYMSVIRLNGSILRIGFRVYYMIKHAAGLSHKKYGLDLEQISPLQVIDAMKEFCNATAGRLKYLLEQNDIITGHSLPFALKGYNELLFKEFSDSIADASWRLQNDERFFIDCSIFYFSKDQNTIEKMSHLKGEFKQELASQAVEMF
ncbi:MAG: hypothetical protein HRU09_10920 [Oligoflexales bacterium]|nr:hypothetical protein [Oligoflexales bacterium]